MNDFKKLYGEPEEKLIDGELKWVARKGLTKAIGYTPEQALETLNTLLTRK